MILFPNVKINLGLFVTGKRSDGYHNIESVFYPVQWCEALEVVPAAISDDRGPEPVRLITHGAEIPGDPRDNIILNVARKLSDVRKVPPLDVDLLKCLPMGAGLGGGSADAAFALRGLDRFLDVSLTDDEALTILAATGSDCPFFWQNTPMHVSGRGEVMEALDLDLSHLHIVLVNPGVHISTREAYANVQIDPVPGIDLRELPGLSWAEWRSHVVNAFEPGIFRTYPELADIKDKLYRMGAEYASMTGSGSTIYGLFQEQPEIPMAWEQYQHWFGRLT